MPPGDQNQPAKDFNPAHWMALENVKESIHFVKYILTHFTSFSTDKDFPCNHSNEVMDKPEVMWDVLFFQRLL